MLGRQIPAATLVVLLLFVPTAAAVASLMIGPADLQPNSNRGHDYTRAGAYFRNDVNYVQGGQYAAPGIHQKEQRFKRL